MSLTLRPLYSRQKICQYSLSRKLGVYFGEQKTFSFLNNQPEALITPILLLQNSTYFGHLLCPLSGFSYCKFDTGKIKVKVKAVCGSYSTAALRHTVLLPE